MRLHYITNVRFQLSFTIAFVFGLLISFLLPAAACVATLYLLSQNSAFPTEQQAALSKGVSQLINIALTCAAALAVFSFFLGGYLSHRFSGPMKRLHNWLVQALDGQDAGPLRLRAGDELSAIAAGLDRLARKRP